LHTLGNLTLTGYNSEYSDRSFKDKQTMKGGFQETPLRVSAGLGQLDSWDEPAIKSREKALATTAISVWASPKLTEDVLQKHRKQTFKVADWSINDHANLLKSPNAKRLSGKWGTVSISSYSYSFNPIKRNFVTGPIVELGCPRTLVGRNSVILTAFLLKPNPGSLAYLVVVIDFHSDYGAHSGKGKEHGCNERSVTKANQS